jgi:hypothetical protein
MAVATSTWIGLALAAAAAGTQYVNTQNTAKRQDQQAATTIRNQSAKQRQADALVAEQVEGMKASTAEASRRKSLDDYTSTLRSRKQRSEAGLTPGMGSARFVADAAQAAQGVADYGSERAGLLAKVDAPGMQRRLEGFSQGRLATDLALVGREAGGQNYLDRLRQESIRRNAGLDALASLMGGASGAAASGGWGDGAAAARSAGAYTTASGYRGLGSVGW